MSYHVKNYSHLSLITFGLVLKPPDPVGVSSSRYGGNSVLPRFDRSNPRRLHLPDRRVDIGVVATPACMGGLPRLDGHRLTLWWLKRLSRQQMRDWYRLTDSEIEHVIRYWAVRGFTKTR